MIHEEICTYEVAKLAKDKGFPQDVDRWLGDLHSATNSNYYNHKGELNGDCIEIVKCKIQKKETPKEFELVAAPTQNLLQRWLREERGIIVEVFMDDDSNMPLTYNIHQYKDWNWECVRHHHGNYYAVNDWELCLEDALQYALENLV